MDLNLLELDESIKSRILSKSQVCQRLNISIRTLQRYIELRCIPFLRLRGKIIFDKNYLEYPKLPETTEQMELWQKGQFRSVILEGEEALNYFLSGRYLILVSEAGEKLASLKEKEEKGKLTESEATELGLVGKQYDSYRKKVWCCEERLLKSENMRILEFFDIGKPIEKKKKEISDVERSIPVSVETRTEVKK